MDHTAVYQELFPFWQELSDEDKELLCQNTDTVCFEKEQAVHNNVGCTGFL